MAGILNPLADDHSNAAFFTYASDNKLSFVISV
jgi:hypothetical protein